MELEFEINNQELERKEKQLIVNKSVNYVSCSFEFKTNDWQGVSKYVIFKNETEQNFCLELGSECTCSCIVPSKALEHDFFRISVFGIVDDTRITTTEKTVLMNRSGFTLDYSSVDGEKDIFTRILERFDDFFDDVVYNEGVLEFYNNEVCVKSLPVSEHTHVVSDITDFPNLANVATSGSYVDLRNKPTIPSKLSDLTNDSDFIEKSDTSGLVKNDGTIDTTTYSTFSGSYNDLSNKPSIPSDVSELTDTYNTAFTPKSHNHTKSDITDFPTLSTVATSGSYNDLSNKPTIADNLTTDDATQVLSAKQGKALADLIGQSISYINQ